MLQVGGTVNVYGSRHQHVDHHAGNRKVKRQKKQVHHFCPRLCLDDDHGHHLHQSFCSAILVCDHDEYIFYDGDHEPHGTFYGIGICLTQTAVKLMEGKMACLQ